MEEPSLEETYTWDLINEVSNSLCVLRSMAVPSEVTVFLVRTPCKLAVHRNILSSILNMGAAHPSETSVEIYQITRHHISEDSILQAIL
jgi:hypothetical protein